MVRRLLWTPLWWYVCSVYLERRCARDSGRVIGAGGSKLGLDCYLAGPGLTWDPGDPEGPHFWSK